MSGQAKIVGMVRPCERAGLEAIVLTWSHWTVDDNGDIQFMVQEYGPDGVEEYHCLNCDLFFSAGDGAGSESIEAAWQRALEHLNVSGAAA